MHLGYGFPNITISTASTNVPAPRGLSSKQEGRSGIGGVASSSKGNDTQGVITPSNRISSHDNKGHKSDRLYWLLVLLIALGSTLFAASSTPWLSLGALQTTEDSLTTAGRFRTEPVRLQEVQTSEEGNWVVPVTEGSPVEAFISNINAKLSSIASVATSITQRASSNSAEPESTGRSTHPESFKRELLDQPMPGEHESRLFLYASLIFCYSCHVKRSQTCCCRWPSGRCSSLWAAFTRSHMAYECQEFGYHALYHLVAVLHRCMRFG